MARLPKPISQVTGEPSWRWRRIAVFAAAAFCCFMLARMIDAQDTELNGTIASGLLWLLGVLILTYCGLATVQDVAAIVTMRTARPYADPAPPPVPVDHPPGPVVVIDPGLPQPADERMP